MIDTLKIYQALKEGELPDEQARAMTVAIQTAETQTEESLKAFIHRELAGLAERLEQKFEVRLAETKSEIVRWMFLFWIGQFAATVGLVLGLHNLAR